MITFPPITDSNTEITAAIDNQNYLFVFRWNDREDGGWFVDVFDDAGASIASGLRVVLGAFIGRRVPHPIFQNGILVALDTAGGSVEAGLTDLGQRVSLTYYDIVEASLMREGVPMIVAPS
jgi:hypothetical protein